MRKSSPKTPLSGLSSGSARLLPAGLLSADAAEPRLAVRLRRSNGRHSNGRTNGARRSGTLSISQDAHDAPARLRLVEGLVSRTDPAECARYALRWLASTCGIARSMCLACLDGHTMAVIASHGLPRRTAAAFSLSMDEWVHPLVSALGCQHTFYPAPRSDAERSRRPATPFDDAPLHAIPLRLTSALGEGEASRSRLGHSVAMAIHTGRGGVFGVLLFAGPEWAAAGLEWFVSQLGQRLDQVLWRQAAEEGDLRQGRERSLLYAIINAVTDPILLTDPEGRLFIANTRALALFTASEADSEGRRGAVRMNNMLLSSALASQAIEESEASRRELLLANPVDGSDLHFELLSAVTHDSRHGTGVVSILRNVTDLRRASEEIEENYRKLRVAEGQARAESERLNLVIDSVADPIVVSDPNGETSLMNAPAERLFATPANASALERRWVQTNDAHFSSFIAGMFLGADQRRVGEIGLVDPRTGDALPVEAIAGKILSERGELTAVVTILHDRRESIEKAKLCEQLRQASDELEQKIQTATADIAQQNELLRRQAIELEQASQLKSQFLANMSHEFRTPLNAILGYTSMLRQGVAGELVPPMSRHLTRIESNGRHLLAIINEILDISRIEAGRMPLRISTFGLPDLVAEVRLELEPIIVPSKLSITTDLPPDLRPISTDRQKLKQILTNLMSNALKFTHQGGVTIAVRSLPKDRTIVLSVSDTGIGIAAADHEGIFEDFRQLDNSPTRAYGGTGLGLSICRRLARMLNGRLSVVSELSTGSTFTLTLPVLERT